MIEEDRIETRAERLRCLIAAIGEEPTMRAWGCFADGYSPGGWSYYFSDTAPEDHPDDLDLAWECAAVAQDLRDRQWDAVERLGALVAAGGGPDIDARILSLPRPQLREAVRALLVLGWLDR